MASHSPLVLGGTLALAFLSCTASVPSDDASVLIQAAVQAEEQQGSSILIDRVKALYGTLHRQPPTGTFDCEKYPKMCQAPFNCQNFSMSQLAPILVTGVAPTGPNIHAWCGAPSYQDYVHTCLAEKDLVKAGHIQYEWSKKLGVGIDQADASYCFLEGHCTNRAVTNKTTLEEASAMCDERYGHDAWAQFGRLDTLKPVTHFPGSVSALMMGFHDPVVTKFFLQAACSMGNYHCDVVYCKETYCKMDEYIKKYSHLSPKAPGDLIQQRDWLP